jgi:hypothetical protein
MKIPATTREERLALLARNNVTQTPVPETPRGVGMGSGNNNGKTKGKGKEPRVPKKQHSNNHLPNEAKPSLEVRNKARLASIKLYDYWKN